LLAVDLNEETAIKYIDRFLMYYIQTADRLTRTSVWLDKMEGGIEKLRDIIVNDRLGIAADLERQMNFVVDTYKCEWAEVVNDPEKRRLFQQFVNTDETESTIEFVHERGQSRPADWSNSFIPSESLTIKNSHGTKRTAHTPQWVSVGKVWDFPADGGGTVKYGSTQIAVFNFSSRGEWYATQNMCPHRREFVLARGLLGDQAGTPKIACPLHKKTFSLESGECLSGEDFKVQTFPVKVDGDDVFIQLPTMEELDAVYATSATCNQHHSCDMSGAVGATA
jgi:NAD(P)H-dependent nitrite reductase small subunit